MSRHGLIGAFTLAAVIAATALPSSASAQTDEAPPAFVVELQLQSGARQRLLYLSPPRPLAVIVMLPGGTGDVGIESDGDLRHGDNFVVRSRQSWVQRGYAVVIPDTIDRTNLRGERSSPDYGGVVDELADFAKSQAGAPVFLLGTSQGTIAAVNGAAHAAPGLVSGVILTESVSRTGRRSRETVFGADPEDIRAPVLIIANKDDRCDVAPPDEAPQIEAAMTHASDVQVRYVSGGSTRSDRACGSLSPHGYYGIETPVVDIIARWIDEHR